MIILKGYKKEPALMVRLKKLSRIFGFTIEIGLDNPDSSKEEALKLEVLELRGQVEKLTIQLNSKSEVKLTAVQVAELIDKAENLEDLKQYESDKRQVVELAYKKKLKEFE